MRSGLGLCRFCMNLSLLLLLSSVSLRACSVPFEVEEEDDWCRFCNAFHPISHVGLFPCHFFGRTPKTRREPMRQLLLELSEAGRSTFESWGKDEEKGGRIQENLFLPFTLSLQILPGFWVSKILSFQDFEFPRFWVSWILRFPDSYWYSWVEAINYQIITRDHYLWETCLLYNKTSSSLKPVTHKVYYVVGFHLVSHAIMHCTHSLSHWRDGKQLNIVNFPLYVPVVMELSRWKNRGVAIIGASVDNRWSLIPKFWPRHYRNSNFRAFGKLYRGGVFSWVKGSVCFVLKFAFPHFSPLSPQECKFQIKTFSLLSLSSETVARICRLSTTFQSCPFVRIFIHYYRSAS